MIELLFVIIIGFVLVSMAVSGASAYMSRQGARNARDAFYFLAVRARAAAIERGAAVRLVVDPGQDRVSLLAGSTGVGDTLETLVYAGEYKADVMTSNGSTVVVCYNARGFAQQPCSTNFADVVVRFARGADTASAVVKGLGQVERQ